MNGESQTIQEKRRSGKSSKEIQDNLMEQKQVLFRVSNSYDAA